MRYAGNVGAAILGLAMLCGCASSKGVMPHSTMTQVDLTRNNYRVVTANAVGSSSGFTLLGLIPIVPPRYTSAMSDLYSRAGFTTGSAQALVNVTQERSYIYVILFSIPKLTVRADIIQFTE